jgi:hypothetical protein
MTSTPKSKAALQTFDFKPAGSAFVKEYTYISEDDVEARRPYSPREHGFTYMEKQTGGTGGDISPISKDELPSPTGKRLTALAFTYKPPESDKVKDKSQRFQTDSSKSPPQSKILSSPVKEVPIHSNIERTKLQTKEKTIPFGQTIIAAPKQSKLPVKASPTPVTLDSNDSKRKSKEKTKTPQKSSLKGKSQTSPKSIEAAEAVTGRTSRQSKDSKLESSSSASSVSSGSSMDEYEKETVKQDPTITATPVKSYDKFSQKTRTEKSDISDKSRIVSSQSSGPKITHASRKRVVTNADGTVEEMEEILEPGIIGSLTSKPVIVGVVPSSGSKTRSSTSEPVLKLHK